MKNHNVIENLKSLYQSYIQTLTNPDVSTLKNFEKDFGIELFSNLKSLQKQEINYSLKNELNNKDIKVEILEILNICGLSTERTKNYPLEQIELIENKYSDGFLHYKFKDDFTLSSFNSKNDWTISLRVVAKISNPGVLCLKEKNEVVQSEDDFASHLVVFEHTFKEVEDLVLMNLKEYEELVELLVFGQWRISDFDGFMNGNSLFRPGNRVSFIEDF